MQYIIVCSHLDTLQRVERVSIMLFMYNHVLRCSLSPTAVGSCYGMCETILMWRVHCMKQHLALSLCRKVVMLQLHFSEEITHGLLLISTLVSTVPFRLNHWLQNYLWQSLLDTHTLAMTTVLTDYYHGSSYTKRCRGIWWQRTVM